ncbi:Uncharacterised protein [Vibrio cholerae]|nr:Uncharacterised protein [Vibrio cholerae]
MEGRKILKVLPTPNSDCTLISPPDWLSKLCETESPSPVPSRLVV